MKRGDVVIAVIPGDHGTPRPAVVMQDELRYGALGSCVIVPLTSAGVDAPVVRVAIAPDTRNGLSQPSHAMVDKVSAVSRQRIGAVIGEVSAERLREITRALTLLLGLASPPPPAAP